VKADILKLFPIAACIVGAFCTYYLPQDSISIASATTAFSLATYLIYMLYYGYRPTPVAQSPEPQHEETGPRNTGAPDSGSASQDL
jgi:hypothetical protein